MKDVSSFSLVIDDKLGATSPHISIIRLRDYCHAAGPLHSGPLGKILAFLILLLNTPICPRLNP